MEFCDGWERKMSFLDGWDGGKKMNTYRSKTLIKLLYATFNCCYPFYLKLSFIIVNPLTIFLIYFFPLSLILRLHKNSRNGYYSLYVVLSFVCVSMVARTEWRKEWETKYNAPRLVNIFSARAFNHPPLFHLQHVFFKLAAFRIYLRIF